jgi:hypothetical protein
MAESNIEIIDVVYPSGAVTSVLKLTCDGKVRVFTGLAEIDRDGMYLANKQQPPKLDEIFNHG